MCRHYKQPCIKAYLAKGFSYLLEITFLIRANMQDRYLSIPFELEHLLGRFVEHLLKILFLLALAQCWKK